MTETRKMFAARITQLRQERALTQEQLAHVAGVSSRTIFNIEKGIYSVTLDTVHKLAQGFGLPPRDLFEF
ncbi:MAG: helix-turn-helix domain-containing protein [Proteobacteria bacterium]|nr:helix-turn-helix domain-containing protein [Pseudomonadota bacterium]